MEITADRMSL